MAAGPKGLLRDGKEKPERCQSARNLGSAARGGGAEQDDVKVGETQVGETRVVVLGKRHSGEYEAWLVTRRRPSLRETGWLSPCKLG